jgi:hypothetical protein
LTRNYGRALQEAESLAEVSGRYAFEQRGNKLALQSASQAPAAMAAEPPGAAGAAGSGPALAARPSGGGYFGGNVTYFDAAKATNAVASTWRQIGRKTFFERDGRLVDSNVTAEQEKSARKIERYSPEYFQLVEKYGKHVAQYLALDEPVLINLGDETYEW